MTARYILAIDQGTTSTRCILFDRAGRLVAVAQREHHQHFPRPGWVEHDAAEIWRNLCRLIPETLHDAGIGLDSLAGVGIANQRETTVVWDRRTGEPVHNAIVWQDTRTDDLVEALPPSQGAAGFGPSAACRWPPTSARRDCAGPWTRPPACASGPSAARCCSARWRPG